VKFEDLDELIDTIINILRDGYFQYLIVILDGFDHFMKIAMGNQLEKVISFLRNVIDDSTQKWIITSSIHIRRKTLFTTLLTTKLHSDRSIGDAQRLLRFYYRCDKYKLKQWIDSTPSHLLTNAYLFQRGRELK